MTGASPVDADDRLRIPTLGLLMMVVPDRGRDGFDGFV